METMALRASERGNVLFLVLIAVVLFAALSYAVTQSTRSQNKNTEGTLLGAAQLTHYPASLRMAALMMGVNGIETSEIEFNAPSDFDDLDSPKIGIFHPDGGGASYQMAPQELMAAPGQGQWYFNAEFEVQNLSLSVSSDYEGNDLIAFLPGIKREICVRIDDEIGIGNAIPQSGSDLSSSYMMMMDNSYVLPSGETVLGTAAGNGTDALTGQPFGCFQNGDGTYVYYQVIVER